MILDPATFRWSDVPLFILVGMFKKYLNDLPQPLFPLLCHPFLEHAMGKNQHTFSGGADSHSVVIEQEKEDERLAALTKCLSQDLPPAYHIALHLVLQHLWVTSENHDLSKDALASVFAPLLIRPDPPSAPYARTCIRDLLNNYHMMFGPIREE